MKEENKFCVDEFDSHAVADWCENDPMMVDSPDQ